MNNLKHVTKNETIKTGHTILANNNANHNKSGLYETIKNTVSNFSSTVKNGTLVIAISLLVMIAATACSSSKSVETPIQVETDTSDINENNDNEQTPSITEPVDVVETIDEIVIDVPEPVEPEPVYISPIKTIQESIPSNYINETAVVETENLIYREVRLDEAALDSLVETGLLEVGSLYEPNSQEGKLVAIAEVTDDSGETYTTIKVDAPAQNFLDITIDEQIEASSIDYIVNSAGTVIDEAENPELYSSLSTQQNESQVEALTEARKDLKNLIDLCGGEDSGIQMEAFNSKDESMGSIVYFSQNNFELMYGVTARNFQFNLLDSNFDYGDWSVQDNGEVFTALDKYIGQNSPVYEIMRTNKPIFEDGMKVDIENGVYAILTNTKYEIDY